ncbi:MAG: transcription-repair coupling factor [Bacteroidales bacterium]|nr:transcription-repair coupling factor [Bacteroidales bacterium]
MFSEKILVINPIKEISANYRSLGLWSGILKRLQAPAIKRSVINGLSGSSKAILCSTLLDDLQGLHIFILDDKEEAAYFYTDLLTCLEKNEVAFLPSSYKRSIQYGQNDSGNIILRTEAINRMSSFQAGTLAIVTYPEALTEKIISRSALEKNTLHLNVGEKISPQFIREVLHTYQFEEADFVTEPGQFALRGSIIDVFSFSAEFPYRIDFFGDEVDSIRSFEVESQLSREQVKKITILPNICLPGFEENYESALSFAAPAFAVWISDAGFVADRLNEIIRACREQSANINTEHLFSKQEFLADLSRIQTVEFCSKSIYPEAETFGFNTRPQPLFQKNFTLLADNLQQQLAHNYETFILSESEAQLNRLHAIFEDTHQGIPFKGILHTLHEGFIDDDLKICCYTDHQIFDRYHKYRLHQYYSGKAAVSLNELKELKPGDYIVHIDHGVGRFGGLEKITINGKMQETIRLVYRDNDVLFVNIHSLHRISKYKGKDDAEPRIHKLGTAAWKNLKEKTKKKVKDIARDLIKLYAQRKTQDGFAFSADTYLQEELEASFLYEDTPDQVKSTEAVKADMESRIPMDRLICGDVGFGKTEVAIRAAFKAVTDNKQVAVLVPTTILALQHATTFRDRLRDFPCSVEYISRLVKPAKQKEILKKVEAGQVDILIGTHRILGSDIRFRDLGLLVIDEEQKFGVSAKEKLRKLRINVDTLTMTATPIPRTLQFSLLGARDLSVINTPPPNRHPIVTELHTFNESIIQEGIEFEVSRGGQIFFIHNRIDTIYEVEAMIKRICPKVKTVVGHGQLDGPKLEKLMIEFINGDYDVLVSTTIIESGLDIPNANTIFINQAQNFGLGDLHQLRGRVGRSNKRAFCYLIAPPPVSLTPEARRRLKAIEELSDLGSGFNISLQDLDIRGAGNMLGAEQSGFIADIGFETYNRILNEAIQELKEKEFQGVYKTDAKPKQPTETEEEIRYSGDCIIETDLGIHIPDEYVANISERIRLYRQIDSLQDGEALEAFEAELRDRFGPLPDEVEALLRVVRIRWLAQILGFEKLIFKNGMLAAYFISNQGADYFSSPTFANILAYVQSHPDLFRIREGREKLVLNIGPLKELNEVYDILSNIKSQS